MYVHAKVNSLPQCYVVANVLVAGGCLLAQWGICF